MDSKKVAKEIVGKFGAANDRIEVLKKDVEDFLLWALREVKDQIGDMPDEESFLKVLAEMIDELVKLPQPYEMFDGFMANIVLKIIDKQILDRFLGADWYSRLQGLVNVN